MLKSNRFEKVGVGQVVTVNSAVVGDGRRTWRCGAVVSILGSRRNLYCAWLQLRKALCMGFNGSYVHVESV